MTVLVRLDALMPEIPDGVTINSVSWEIATDSAFNNIVYSSPNDAVNLKTLYRILPSGSVYYGRSMVHTSIGDTDWSPAAVCQNDIERPTIDITGYPAAISTAPTFTGSPFNAINGTWQIQDVLWKVADTDGEILWSASSGTSTTISMPIGYLKSGRRYSVHVTYVGTDGNTQLESPMGVVDFNVEGVIIQAPLITIVGTPSIQNGLHATTSGFTVVVGSDFHVSTSWVIKDSAGNSLVSSLNNSVNLTDINLSLAGLNAGDIYYLEVTHNGNTAVSPTAVVSITPQP